MQRETNEHGEVVQEQDVRVVLRDGATIGVDLHRPRNAAQPLPVLLVWGRAGSHRAPDPTDWCPHGYVIAIADPRQAGDRAADDLVDTIEWLGAAAWSNGRVGMLGAGELAGAAFVAAATRPASLAAISVWECDTDWSSRPEVVLEDVETPAFVVAGWSGHDRHARGTLDAVARIRSAEVWLDVHGHETDVAFSQPENVARQRVFFDHYLHDRGPGPRDWPRVRLEIRDDTAVRSHRTDFSWPVREDRTMRMHVDVAAGRLAEQPTEPSSASFDAASGELTLRFAFDEDTDIVGPMRLRLWLEAEAADDAEVFVVARKLRADGSAVDWPIDARIGDGPIAVGCLRASDRALDETRSTVLRPVHPRTEATPIVPGEPMALDIGLSPSATRFHDGEQLEITVLGRDVFDRGDDHASPVMRRDGSPNRGTWRVHSGGEHDSYLALYAMLADA